MHADVRTLRTHAQTPTETHADTCDCMLTHANTHACITNHCTLHVTRMFVGCATSNIKLGLQFGIIT